MKLDKLHEASELSGERATLLALRAHIEKPDAKIGVDRILDGALMPLLRGMLYEYDITIDLAEHPRIVAALRTQIEADLAPIEAKLRELNVEIEDAPARS